MTPTLFPRSASMPIDIVSSFFHNYPSLANDLSAVAAGVLPVAASTGDFSLRNLWPLLIAILFNRPQYSNKDLSCNQIECRFALPKKDRLQDDPFTH